MNTGFSNLLELESVASEAGKETLKEILQNNYTFGEEERK